MKKEFSTSPTVPPISTKTTSALLGQGQFAEPEFDFAGDVGDHLDIPALVAAAAFFIQHAGKNLAGGGEIEAGEILIQDPLVGSQIHIGFHAVVEDEDFAMAIGIEGAGVDIEVSFQLDGRNFQPFILDEFGHAGGKDSLAQSAHHGTENDHVFALAQFVAGRNRCV